MRGCEELLMCVQRSRDSRLDFASGLWLQAARKVGGADVVLHTTEGDKIECMIWLDFPMTNNEAKYEALLEGLDLAKAARVENIVVYCNSQVVTS